MNKEKIFSDIKKEIQKAKKIVLLTHKKPDGDCLGALLAMHLVLKKIKKEVYPVSKEIPERFLFLPNSNEIQKEFPKKYDLSIALDLGSLSLLDFKIKPDLNIDHHPTNSLYGKINLVLPEYAATSQILFDFFEYLKIEIDKDISTCLLGGIFDDTSSFQNQNTTKEVLKVSSKLLLKGARLSKIAENTFYKKSIPSLKIWGKALERLWENKKLNMVITIITKKDLKETGASYEDIEGVANFLNTIPSCKAILVLSEKENGGIKGSLRTRREEVDVSKLASLFDGGGHKKAAGFEIEGKLKYDGKWRVV